MKSKLKAWLDETWLFPRRIGTVYMVPAMRQAARRASGRLLDIGCGLRRYESIFKGSVVSYIGIDWPRDMERARPDVVADALRVPIADGSADTIVATELMEHLPDPDGFLAEVARLLKLGGILILSVPFLEPLHEEPRDFYRFTPYSLARLLQSHGYFVETISSRGGWWSVTLGSFASQALYDWASPPDQEGRRHYSAFTPLVLPICSLLQFSAFWLDKVFTNHKYTLGYVVVARLTATKRNANPGYARMDMEL